MVLRRRTLLERDYERTTCEHKKSLETAGFLESSATLHFGKVAEAYEFRMVCLKDYLDDDEMPNDAKMLQDELSKAMDGKGVTIMLCDNALQAAYTVEAE